MHVIARRALREFWEEHPNAEQPLKAWFHEVARASWNNTADLKRRFPSASVITRDRIVLNICGNNFRLIARISFTSQTLSIRFMGTPKEYDRVDPETV